MYTPWSSEPLTTHLPSGSVVENTAKVQNLSFLCPAGHTEPVRCQASDLQGAVGRRSPRLDNETASLCMMGRSSTMLMAAGETHGERRRLEAARREHVRRSHILQTLQTM